MARSVVAVAPVTAVSASVKSQSLASTTGHYASATTGCARPMMVKFVQVMESVTVAYASVPKAGTGKPVSIQLRVT